MASLASEIKFREGTFWTFIEWGVKLFLKFLSNLILTRLLPPHVFGIAAIGNTVISGIEMLSDFGVRQNIVRSHRTDDRYFQTAWTVQFLRGLALAIVIVILAKPLALFYKAPELALFLVIVAGSNLAMGLNNIEVLRDTRFADLRLRSIIGIISTIVGLLAMALWAWISPTSIALAVGAVVSTASFTIATFWVYRRHNCRFCFDKESLQDFVVFGKWVLISTMFAFVTLQVDRLALGKLVSMQELGLYSIALIWASFPNQILGKWGNGVFYPLISSHVRNDSGVIAIWTVRRNLVTVAVAASVFMCAVADILVQLLYSKEYQGVAPLIRQLTAVYLLYTIEQSYSHILIAHGRPKDKVAGQAISLVLFAVLLLPMFNWAGILGVVWLLGIAAVVRIAWKVNQISESAFGEVKFDIGYFGIFAFFSTVLVAMNQKLPNLWVQGGVTFLELSLVLLIVWHAYRQLKREF